MMSCREISHHAAPEAYEAMSFRRRMEFRFHTFMCVHCRRYVRQIRQLGEAMRRAFAVESEPHGLEDEIVRACTRPRHDGS